MTEINKYQNGKIYKIVCNKTKLVYIGSTIQKYLCNRLKNHFFKYNMYLDNRHHYVSSYKILENNDYYIELVELFPCNSKDELLVRERYYYDLFECVNMQKPKITLEEKKEYRKNYHIENKEYRKERRSIKYTCECGSISMLSQKTRHECSKKHIKYLNQINLL